MNYILVTPCKNEEKHIERLIFSVKAQTKRPALWVIINDKSTDRTKELIMQHKCDWIAFLDLKSNKSGIGLHLARVIRLGFHTALKLARLNNIQFSYIGLLDADMVLERTYFEKLMEAMEQENVGIASGTVYSLTSGIFEKEDHKSDLPRGGARLWKTQCFIDTEGFKITYSPDSVSNVEAKLKGWKTKQYPHIKAFQYRETSTRNGIWRGYKIEGISCYYRDVHSLYILAKSIALAKKKSPKAGFAFFSGYIHGCVHRVGKLNDKSIRKYYRYTKVRDLFKNE